MNDRLFATCRDLSNNLFDPSTFSQSWFSNFTHLKTLWVSTLSFDTNFKLSFFLFFYCNKKFVLSYSFVESGGCQIKVSIKNVVSLFLGIYICILCIFNISFKIKSSMFTIFKNIIICSICFQHKQVQESPYTIMDSWTNVKTSKCVYHLKDNYTQMLLNTNYYIDHHEKWGKDYKIFMLIMTWHAEGWQTYLHSCWQMCYTMVLLNLVFFLKGSRHCKLCEHYHSPF